MTINTPNINSLVTLTSVIPFFEVNSTKENKKNYQDFLNTIDEIFFLSAKIIISGDFRIINEETYNNINKNLTQLKSDFGNINLGTREIKKLNSITFHISEIEEIILKMKELNFQIENRRNDIYYIGQNIGKGYGEKDNTAKKIFEISLLSVIFDIFTVNDLGKSAISTILEIKEDLLKFKDDQKYSDIVSLLEQKLDFNIYKFSLILGDENINIYKSNEISNFSINEHVDIFKSIIDDLKIIHGENYDYEKIKFSINEINENNNYRAIDLLLYIKYYKEKECNTEKIEVLFKRFKSIYNKNDIIQFINLIYLGNNYLSLLVNSFSVSDDIDEGKILKDKIEKLFKEINSLYENSKYKNYFTYTKYGEYKIIECEKILNEFDNIRTEHIVSYKKLNKIIVEGKKSIEKAKDFLDNDKSKYHYYFEFDDDSNYIYLKNSISNIDKIYCFNLYATPFNNKGADKVIEELKNKFFRLELDIEYKERFNNVETNINSNKHDAMAIIGLFTGIVVYSVGTIQIFSIIEDIGSAILFAGIFLSGILFLIGSIFFKTFSNLKTDIKYNKGAQLFVVAICLLIITFLGKFYYSGGNGTLNINKGNKSYQELKKEVENAEKINQELKDNIAEMKKIKQQ